MFNKLQLSIGDTNVLKGIALILLLIHHLFYTGSMPVDDIIIGNYSLVQTVGISCKVCVAIFVFLSGYGLTISTEKKGGIGSIWQFYKRRYLKLMPNYWIIYLIFVPVGVFVMNRGFGEIYHHSVWRAIWDFLGIHYAMTGDCYGYNPTWWFYSCIILLYALYPLIYKYRRHWWTICVISLIAYVVGGKIPVLLACRQYLPVFVLGIYAKDIRFPKYLGQSTLLVLFVFASAIRLLSFVPIVWDAVIVLVMVMTYTAYSISTKIKIPLMFLGKHSFNIFLFHTFIYDIYFKKYIYWTTNPVLIFMTLLFSCMLISILLEYFKSVLKINKI